MSLLDKQPNLFLHVGETEFQQWRHNPLSAAFLVFLADQAANFRQAAMDLWEAGRLGQESDVLRGRVMTLEEIGNLKLEAIQDFYRNEDSNEGTTS
jgi:hypothetical protein